MSRRTYEWEKPRSRVTGKFITFEELRQSPETSVLEIMRRKAKPRRPLKLPDFATPATRTDM